MAKKSSKQHAEAPGFNTQRSMIVTMFLIAIVLFLFANVKIDINNTYVYAKGTLSGKETVYYDEINEVFMTDTLDMSDKEKSTKNFKINCGTYIDKEWGTYDLFAYKDSVKFVVIRHDGGTLVIGQKTVADTENDYNTIVKYWNEAKADPDAYAALKTAANGSSKDKK